MSIREAKLTACCDNPSCEAQEEVVKDVRPVGWYSVKIVAADGKLPGGMGLFDLCSLDCMAEWALERDSVLKAAA